MDCCQVTHFIRSALKNWAYVNKFDFDSLSRIGLLLSLTCVTFFSLVPFWMSDRRALRPPPSERWILGGSVRDLKKEWKIATFLMLCSSNEFHCAISFLQYGFYCSIYDIPKQNSNWPKNWSNLIRHWILKWLHGMDIFKHLLLCFTEEKKSHTGLKLWVNDS